jgi:hypothetical protein
MAYQVYSVVGLGKAKAGLPDVGYTLDGRARTTAGVVDRGDGDYGALVTVPGDQPIGITWDSGEDPPIRVSGGLAPAYLAPSGLDAAVVAPGLTAPLALHLAAAFAGGGGIRGASGDDGPQTITIDCVGRPGVPLVQVTTDVYGNRGAIVLAAP